MKKSVLLTLAVLMVAPAVYANDVEEREPLISCQFDQVAKKDGTHCEAVVKYCNVQKPENIAIAIFCERGFKVRCDGQKVYRGGYFLGSVGSNDVFGTTLVAGVDEESLTYPTIRYDRLTFDKEFTVDATLTLEEGKVVQGSCEVNPLFIGG